MKFKNLWSKQGAVGKSRTGAAGRPRPQAVDGGLVHPTPRRASAGWATRSVVHASASVLAVGKSRTGAAGRPRPQAVDGGLVHGSLAQAVERIQRGTGGGPPLGGGDRGQSPLVGISGEAPKRIFYLSACSKPCFRFA